MGCQKLHINTFYPTLKVVKGDLYGQLESGVGSYRYGFNGKEADDEVSGEGNQYDYGFRIYNPRIAKFLSVDPLSGSYPWYTPYQFAGNKPIVAIDLDGLEEKIVIHYKRNDHLQGVTIIYVPKSAYLLKKTEEQAKQEREKASLTDALTRLNSSLLKAKKKDRASIQANITSTLGLIEVCNIIIAEQELFVVQHNIEVEENYNKVAYVERDVSQMMINQKQVDDMCYVFSGSPNLLKELVSEGVLKEALDGNEILMLNTPEALQAHKFENAQANGKVGMIQVSFPTELKATFDTNSDKLSSQDKIDIDKNLYLSLKLYPGMKIELIGHTNSQKTTFPGGNPGLSEARANAVRTYLISKGIDSTRLKASGVGSTQPKLNADGTEDMEGSKRTEIKTLK